MASASCSGLSSPTCRDRFQICPSQALQNPAGSLDDLWRPGAWWLLRKPFCCNCAHSVDGRHGDVTDAVEAGAARQRRDGAEQPGGLAQLGRSARQQHGRVQAPGRRVVSAGQRSVRGPACMLMAQKRSQELKNSAGECSPWSLIKVCTEQRAQSFWEGRQRIVSSVCFGAGESTYKRDSSQNGSSANEAPQFSQTAGETIGSETRHYTIVFWLLAVN